MVRSDLVYGNDLVSFDRLRSLRNGGARDEVLFIFTLNNLLSRRASNQVKLTNDQGVGVVV